MLILKTISADAVRRMPVETYSDLIHALKNNTCINTNCDRVGLVRQVLFNLNHPDQYFRIIHVVGTHGKHNFIKALRPLMTNSGLKIACLRLNDSDDPCERIRINGRAISRENFMHSYWQINCHLPLDMEENSLTLREWTFLIAMNYFVEQNVDWLILPAGIGGIGDTSNAIGAPDLVVVTSCCMDHWRKLGTTRRAIAQAKAGVVKTGTRAVIVGPEIDGEFHERIAAIINSKGVKVIESSQFVTLTQTKEGAQPAFLQVKTPLQHFDLRLAKKPDQKQLRNIYLILTTVNWLKNNGLTVQADHAALAY
jgi:dihydrofolate synthase/folylpolyglutamate synthase